MVFTKGESLEGERYLEVLSSGHLERNPSSQTLPAAARKDKISSHFSNSPRQPTDLLSARDKTSSPSELLGSPSFQSAWHPSPPYTSN